jgi:hypothetical protein
MTARKLYTASARRSGGWWAISVDGLAGAHTQVRRLDQAEAMAREVIALVLDTPGDSFDVLVTPELTRPQRAALNDLERAKANYAEASAEMTRRQREVAGLLVKKDGLTVRDAATVLGVSFQRVSQLTSELDGMLATGEMASTPSTGDGSRAQSSQRSTGKSASGSAKRATGNRATSSRRS